jgi:drug/metabolite transporter (DMT)-like permease
MSRLFGNIVALLLYAVSSSAAVLLLKLAMPRLREAGGISGWRDAIGLSFIAGAALYALSFLLWLRVLSRMPLSVAYPSAISLTLAFSIVLAVLCLGERLTPPRIAGIALVLTGALVLTRES